MVNHSIAVPPRESEKFNQVNMFANSPKHQSKLLKLETAMKIVKQEQQLNRKAKIVFQIVCEHRNTWTI